MLLQLHNIFFTFWDNVHNLFYMATMMILLQKHNF